MALSKAQQAWNEKYLREKYESIAIRVHKREMLSTRLNIAASRRGISKREYVKTAIENMLDADGVTLATLEQPVNEAQPFNDGKNE